MAIKKVEIAVISDVHLGTYGSKAEEVLLYLNSIDPEILVVNGDLIDIWQFRKRYFPKSHLAVLQKIFSLAANGTPVYFLPGNHDDLIRKFGDFSLGNLHIQNELVLNINGEKVWFHHGDKYDKSVGHQGISAFGGRIYEGFILLEKGLNRLLKSFKIKPIQAAKKIKSFSKKMSKTALDFEAIAMNEAIARKFDVMVCGHVHQPQNRMVTMETGSLLYLNSGDWVENLTALEYENNCWTIVHFSDFSLERLNAISEKVVTPKIEHNVLVFDLN
ncbi:MAG: UDP-2,3-diacylglucosamine diphosphatase [Saprospiraceae bacterium]|nr:UDP-2,3-diacylglucosamine diphosphatase [Saprospiraceae bacterium]